MLLGLGLGLKAKIFGLGLAPCGLVNVTAWRAYLIDRGYM